MSSTEEPRPLLHRLAPWLAFAGALAVLDLVFLGPSGAARNTSKLLAVSGETFVLALLLWPLVMVGAAPEGRRWFGTWRAQLVAVVFTALWAFEVSRQVGFQAMGEQPLLYDLSALARHLFILARDLMGARVYAVIAGLGGLLVAVWALSTFLYARIEASLRAPNAHLRALVAGGLVLIGIWPAQPYKTRWTSHHLRGNLAQSFDLWQELRRGVSSEAYEPYRELRLQQRPEVRIYVVESYGRLLATEEGSREAWETAVSGIDEALRAGGWTTASGWCTAPVSGGRSWIADASLLLGLRVAHQSSYEHVIAAVDSLYHLPRFFADQGYSTVLVRPKDKARPGVKLVNHFRFAHPVFADDLQYRGPAFGWGVIPDQYTINFVEEQVVRRQPAPHFAFMHLVSSHVPWDEPPPLLETWTEVQGMAGRRKSKYLDRSLDSQLEMELRRYRREETGKGGRELTDELLASYWGTVAYDLHALRQHLATAPDKPALVVIMGDHQPPLLGAERNADVPMHVLANDPALLEAFQEAGFTPGMIPRASEPALNHEGFFSLLVRALATADGQEPPPFLKHGASGAPETAPAPEEAGEHE